MRLLFLLILNICFSSFGISQTNYDGLLNIEDEPILYKNSIYSLNAMVEGYEGFFLQGFDMKITKVSGSYYSYKIETGSSDSCKLEFFGVDKIGSSSMISSYSYLLIDKPKPNIMIDNILVGNYVDSTISNFNYNYTLESKLRGSFSILSWMVKSNLGVFHGEGFKINEEVKKMISECESDSTLVVELKIQDQSAKNTKSVKGVFLIK